MDPLISLVPNGTHENEKVISTNFGRLFVTPAATALATKMTATSSSCKVAVLLLYLGSIGHGKPWEPEPRPEAEWLAQHESYVRNSQENGTNIHCVFIGSSSIEYWATTGKDLWEAKYLPLGTANYGIGGDRTQHVLWRIANGELDGLNPRLIVVYAGSNNIIDVDDTVEEIVQGMTTVLRAIQDKLPHTKILQMEIFPRGGRDIENRWNRITAVNNEVHKLNNGSALVSLNIFRDLAESWLVIKDELYEEDKFHLNKDGYGQWDVSWNSTFWSMWGTT